MSSEKGSPPSRRKRMEVLEVREDASRYMVKSEKTTGKPQSFYARHKKLIIWGVVGLTLVGILLLILGLRWVLFPLNL